MYYASGNYEAFARPEKPKNVDGKSAYLVGSGLGSLAVACFLIRDGQMEGNRIHILEEQSIAGGACDGINDPQKGFIIRGGREIESHYECLWELFRSIPSLENSDLSVLDEFYRLDKNDPNYSLLRVCHERGKEAIPDKSKFNLSDNAAMQMIRLYLATEESLNDTTINDFFDDEFYNSNFWLYFQTMLAFQKWHSALEMKRYLRRFIHTIYGFADMSVVKFSRYNQYESFIKPILKYLEDHGVDFQYDVQVTNVVFDITKDKKVAKEIVCIREGQEQKIAVTENDLVFVTNGSCTEASSLGDNNEAPSLAIKPGEGGCWQLWKNIANQDPSFGHPEKFCSNLEASHWESATVTTLDTRIPKYIEQLAKRDPFSGTIVTGGIITFKDSNWLMSFVVHRQPHFKEQPKDKVVAWIYGLNCYEEGNFVKKPMNQCTGTEIVQEWLYHMGVPVDKIVEMAKTGAHCIPCIMPYITAFFMPRKAGDRPHVVPEGSTNFAFIGQFTESKQEDIVFTIEYSVRTAMEAVYTLLNIDRGVPEVFASTYDIRVLLDSTSRLLDGKKLQDIKLPIALPEDIDKQLISKLNNTVVLELLHKYNLI